MDRVVGLPTVMKFTFEIYVGINKMITVLPKAMKFASDNDILLLSLLLKIAARAARIANGEDLE